ncbi:MAG: sugar ABC transporter permease [Chloroherpetonaceae bacterium]|nr:sugar ABC transporter permease [Chloroherpetonaceae bacterium]
MQVATKLERTSVAQQSATTQDGQTHEPAGKKFNPVPYLYALPALIVMAAVVLYPFIYNVVVSFSNMNLEHFQDWRFKGFSNYISVLTDSKFWWFLFKTILWTVTNVFFHVTIGVFLAILLDKNIRAKNLFRVILILPWAVPQYITALNWRGLFNSEYGAVNQVLAVLGLERVQWLSTEWGAFAACLIANIWLGFPFMMVVALGGLQSIPDALYEAAEINGANWYHKLRHITIPLLKPVMIPAITLGTIWTFNNFNVVWLVSNGGEPSDQTHILVSWVYKVGLNYFRIGYAAAFSMIIFVMLLVFSWNFIKRTKATQSVY